MTTGRHFLVASEAAVVIRSKSDISNAISAAFGSAGLILAESDVAPEFFDLKTGLAGELFQKFTNYKLRLVVIVPEPGRFGRHFDELAREHHAHDMIRIVGTKDEAVAWANLCMSESAPELIRSGDELPNP